MGIFSKHYIKFFVHRYDKEVGIPYYSSSDCIGLRKESYKFTNSDGIEIAYFYYYQDNYKKDKIELNPI